MNKGELVDKVAAETSSSKSEAQDHVDAILSVIEDELKSGGEVNITGFGKFAVQERDAREGVNPQTGERMQIKASRTPKFSAGNALKKSIS
ncbi:MAG: HU family DNA-binding protein [Rubrobacter sp.]|nr:HU family DNA-binding protein [Rubrobacter sp.]